MNWRDIGDMTEAEFVTALAGDSPIRADARAVYRAVQPHSILYRAILKHESQDGTLGVATKGTKNPDGQRPRSDTDYPESRIYENENGAYLKFASYEDAARSWFARVTDPEYAYAGTATVAEFVHTYAPSSDGNNEAEYVAVIESYAARYQGGTPMPTITFGKVPHPAFVAKPITKPPGFGQDDLGPRTVKGVVWHRILGSLNGTTQHFSNPNVGALTDYGVGVAAKDGAALAGTIYRWNDPRGRQSGWASGSYSAAHAYGDGAAFVNKYGVNAINRDQASIEISGDQTTPLDDKARDAIAGLTAYWADQYKIPWDQFPIAPQDGFSFVRWHQEFGPDLGKKKCPFDVVIDETPDLIERARAIMKRYQTQGQPTKPPKPKHTPKPITWQPGEIGFGKLDGQTVRKLVIEVIAKRDTTARADADPKAPTTHPTIQAKRKLKVIGTQMSPKNNRQWHIVDMGDGTYPRVLASAFTPALPKP